MNASSVKDVSNSQVYPQAPWFTFVFQNHTIARSDRPESTLFPGANDLHLPMHRKNPSLRSAAF